MHMADALLSPAVGTTMWAATATTIAICSRKVQHNLDDRKIPLMGVLGAFIFAAQMINFTIPGTGSSGHLGGGMILAILLGPSAAFLTIASVLTVQALFFADGGLLALGCNIFNLGVFPCFLAYPFIYRPIAGHRPAPGRIAVAATLSSIIGLLLGAVAVVFETVASGISALPLTPFLSVMLPIHLAIGLVEGLITTAVVTFIWNARPEILELSNDAKPLGNLRIGKVLAGLALATIVTGGTLSWFASARPDGLEWSIFQVSGSDVPAQPEQGIHHTLASLQEKASFLPDYTFREASAVEIHHDGADQASQTDGSHRTMIDSGTTTSGLVGGALTLLLAGSLGLILRRRSSPLV